MVPKTDVVLVVVMIVFVLLGEFNSLSLSLSLSYRGYMNIVRIINLQIAVPSLLLLAENQSCTLVKCTDETFQVFKHLGGNT